jgi:hypothetical protein
MNSQFLLEKLKNSKEYKEFIKENKTAYLCSGFFVIDMENSGSNQYHFDFYVPESGKTFSFELEGGVKLIPLERDEQALEEVSMKNHFDFDKIREKILTEMELKKISNKLQKMLFSLQKVKGKEMLLGTIFISNLGLLRVNMDIDSNQITDFEKKSLFDMMKMVKK